MFLKRIASNILILIVLFNCFLILPTFATDEPIYFSTNFEDNTEGEIVPHASNDNYLGTDKFSKIVNGVGYGCTVGTEDGVNNKFMKYWNTTSTTYYLQANKLNDFTLSNKVMISYKVKTFENDAYIELADNSKATPPVKILVYLYKANGKNNIGIREGSTTVIKGQYDPDNWLDVRLICDFDSNKVIVWCAGEYKGETQLFTDKATDLTKMNVRCKAVIAQNKYVYLDDLKIIDYSVPRCNILNNQGTETNDITIDFRNPPIKAADVTKEKIIIKDENNNIIPIKSVTSDKLDIRKYRITLENNLEYNKNYTADISAITDNLDRYNTTPVLFKTRDRLFKIEEQKLFLNGDTNELSKLEDGSLKTQVKVQNELLNNRVDFNLMTAIYNNDGSIAEIVLTKDKSETNNVAQPFYNNIYLDTAESKILKVFLWDNLKIPSSLIKVKSYDTNGVIVNSPGTKVASTSLDVTYDINTDNETITLTASTNGKNEIVDAVVTFDGKDVDNINYSDLSNIKNIISYIDEKTTGEDGKAVFTYKLPSKNQIYNARFTLSDSKIYKDISFEFFPKSFIEEVRILINSVNDSAGLKGIIETYKKALDLKIPLYDEISNNDTMPIYKTILDIKNAKTNKEFLNAVQIKEAFNIGVVLRAMDLENSNADLVNLIASYGTLLGLNASTAYGIYDSFSQSTKENISESFRNKGIYTQADALNLLNEKTITTAIYQADKWADGETIMKTVDDIVKLDWTIYDRLKDKSKVFKNIIGETYSNIAAIKTKFDSEVAKQYTSEQATKGSSSGGGGSSPAPTKTIKTDAGSLPKQDAVVIEPAFRDLENHSWAKVAIETLEQRKIISGISNGLFAPDSKVKKEEFIKMLVLTLDLKSDTASSNYTDVKADDWFYSYVSIANEQNILKGKTDGSFGVGDYLTRQEMAALVYRAIKGLNIETNSSITLFSDNDEISDYAVEGATYLKQAGFIKGKDNEKFAPLDQLTRAEAAKVIFEILGRMK